MALGSFVATFLYSELILQQQHALLLQVHVAILPGNKRPDVFRSSNAKTIGLLITDEPE